MSVRSRRPKRSSSRLSSGPATRAMTKLPIACAASNQKPRPSWTVSDGPMGVLSLDLADGRSILVYPKPDYTPATYTVLNFAVDDVDAAMDELGSRGVEFERYDGFEQDDRGIARAEGPVWAREDGDSLRLLSGDPFAGTRDAAASVERQGARLLPPVVPSKIVAIGLNYKDHAAERGKPLPAEPLIFLKPPSAVIGPGETIQRPPWAGRVDHEAEMGIVIGRTARSVVGGEGR